MEINGIAHIALVVNRFDFCAPFYEKLLNFLGLKTVHKNEKYLYCVGGKTAVGIGASDEMHKNEKFDQTRIGLHHLCFRARERSDIDLIYQFLLEMKAKIVHPPEDGPWGPGYYSVLFEDPDGIRLEINHIPGKGIFEEGKKFNPSKDYI